MLQFQVHPRDLNPRSNYSTARNQHPPQKLKKFAKGRNHRHRPGGTSLTGPTSAILHSRVWVTTKERVVTKVSVMIAGNHQTYPLVLPPLTASAKNQRNHPMLRWFNPPPHTQCFHSCTHPTGYFLHRLRCLSLLGTCSEALPFLRSFHFSALDKVTLAVYHPHTRCRSHWVPSPHITRLFYNRHTLPEVHSQEAALSLLLTHKGPKSDQCSHLAPVQDLHLIPYHPQKQQCPVQTPQTLPVWDLVVPLTWFHHVRMDMVIIHPKIVVPCL